MGSVVPSASATSGILGTQQHQQHYYGVSCTFRQCHPGILGTQQQQQPYMGSVVPSASATPGILGTQQQQQPYMGSVVPSASATPGILETQQQQQPYYGVSCTFRHWCHPRYIRNTTTPTTLLWGQLYLPPLVPPPVYALHKDHQIHHLLLASSLKLKHSLRFPDEDLGATIRVIFLGYAADLHRRVYMGEWLSKCHEKILLLMRVSRLKGCAPTSVYKFHISTFSRKIWC